MNMKAPTGETPAADEFAADAMQLFDDYQEYLRLKAKNEDTRKRIAAKQQQYQPKETNNDTTQKPRPEELAHKPAAPHS